MIDLSIHRCTHIEVSMRMPDNANMIQLLILSKEWCDGHDVETKTKINFFDLPETVTDAMLVAFGHKAATPDFRTTDTTKGKDNE